MEKQRLLTTQSLTFLYPTVRYGTPYYLEGDFGGRRSRTEDATNNKNDRTTTTLYGYSVRGSATTLRIMAIHIL